MTGARVQRTVRPTICRAFQAAGGCDAGDQCPDIHPWPRALSIGNAIACGLAGYLRTAPITVEGLVDHLHISDNAAQCLSEGHHQCNDFLYGRCKSGEDCALLHRSGRCRGNYFHPSEEYVTPTPCLASPCPLPERCLFLHADGASRGNAIALALAARRPRRLFIDPAPLHPRKHDVAALAPAALPVWDHIRVVEPVGPTPRAVSEAGTTLADLHEVPSLFEAAYQQALTESDALEFAQAETLYDYAWAQAADTQAQDEASLSSTPPTSFVTDKTEASSQRPIRTGSLPQPSPPERPTSLPQPLRTRPSHLTPAALQQTTTAPPRRAVSVISTTSDPPSTSTSPAERALSLRRVIRQIGWTISTAIADDCEALTTRARTLGRLALVSKAIMKRAVPVLYERRAIQSHEALLALAGRFDDRWRSDTGALPQMRELVLRVGVGSLNIVAKLVRLCPKLTDFDLEVDGGGESTAVLALSPSHKLVVAIGALDRLRRLAILFDGKTVPLCTVNALVRSPRLVEIDLLNVVLPTSHPWSDGCGWSSVRTMRLHEPRLTAYELDKVLKTMPRLRTLELSGMDRPLAITPSTLHDVLRGWSGPRQLRRIVVETGMTVDWRANGEALGRLGQLCDARLGIVLAVDCTA